jgi:hypothetical protein
MSNWEQWLETDKVYKPKNKINKEKYECHPDVDSVLNIIRELF